MRASDESLFCEIILDVEQLEQKSEFKYLGCTWDEKGMDDVECSCKVVDGRKVFSAIKSLVDAKRLSLGCPKVLHEDNYRC